MAFTRLHTVVSPMSNPASRISAWIWVLVSCCFPVRSSLRFSSSDARISSRKSSISAFHLRGGDFLSLYAGAADIDSAASRTASGGAPGPVITACAASYSATYLPTVLRFTPSSRAILRFEYPVRCI